MTYITVKAWMLKLLSQLSGITIGGTLTPTGGLVATLPGRVSNIPIGSVALSSLGTSAVHTAGSIYVSEVFLPANKTLTGISVLNGATVGTDNILVALYSSAGALLANSALAGALSAGANTWQEVPFTATYAAVGPARYFVAVQCNGTTATTRRIAASTFLNFASVTAGVFGTLPAITPPTATTATAGPIAYLY